MTDDQLAVVIFLARRGASRAAISRATGVSLRQVFYFIGQHCPDAPNEELSVADALKVSLSVGLASR